MEETFSRTEALIGKEALNKLKNSRVAVFGLGGVGGHSVEALARSGVGALDLIDGDKVAQSNINRQIFALQSTLGQYKCDVAKRRIADINPDCKVNIHKIFYLPEVGFDFSVYDYVVDAIDTVTGKIAIIENAAKCGVPVISCMGAGNKTDPTAFRVADVFQTSVCPLARVMRRELKKRGIEKCKAVYSEEEPKKSDGAPASCAFVPSVAGLIVASEVIKDLIK